LSGEGRYGSGKNKKKYECGRKKNTRRRTKTKGMKSRDRQIRKAIN
jgi:hypothetical protein